MQAERSKSNHEFVDMVGQSAEIRRLYRTIPRVASSRHPILLLGETGTGKETVARAIHSHGLFPEGPFVVVDCATVAPTLLEGGLSVQAASKLKERLIFVPGTIFLDEVAALLPDLQAKLVRALQEREIRPAGGVKAIPAEARVIAASSRDLQQAVEQGTFRRDLYALLNVVTMRLPALRDRKDDIRLLAEHCLESLAAGRGARYSISPEAMKLLMGYDWPGNVRELEDCLASAVAASSGPVLNVSDFPPQIQTSFPVSGNNASGDGNRIVPLAEVERQTILSALERLNGDKLMTARALGIGKTTLYRKLKEYGMGGSDGSWIPRTITPR
jgi:DNA-binding NtrC family response regulator